MLIMFIPLGRNLETFAKGKTSAGLTDLMALAPSMAIIYTDATCTRKKVPTVLLQIGDTGKVVPGERVPADGTVVRGSSGIDESAITVGDSMVGGTVNGLGAFGMVVTWAGKDTALAQIHQLVKDAQMSEASIQAFADRVAGCFVPDVLSLAVVSTGVGAKNGILIKGGHRHGDGGQTHGCERRLGADHAAEVDGAALQTTMATDGVTTRAAVVTMFSVTKPVPSTHLPRRSTVWNKSVLPANARYAPDASIEAFESITGQGVRATVTVAAQWKYTVWVGSARFVAQTDVGGRLPAGLAEFEAREAQTPIYVAIASSASNMSAALALALADAPRRSSARAVRALQDMGIEPEVNLMTGDGRETALVVARQVGIAPEGVWAGMSPKGKAGMVAELMERDGGGVETVRIGSPSAMSALTVRKCRSVTGSNDSPALAVATVCIALSSGTSVGSDLLDMVAALDRLNVDLSRAIFDMIRRKLRLHPMMAGAMMAFSSVCDAAREMLHIVMGARGNDAQVNTEGIGFRVWNKLAHPGEATVSVFITPVTSRPLWGYRRDLNGHLGDDAEFLSHKK
ncbi:hypothetical protein EDB85DRAFT_2283597 [Lactarius pseudohatsudake]|nr:hypothetical protein EDB85DRAFT_2283597 [Lactarius pseudohatsudake]